jgi:hypothetical protein
MLTVLVLIPHASQSLAAIRSRLLPGRHSPLRSGGWVVPIDVYIRPPPPLFLLAELSKYLWCHSFRRGVASTREVYT